MNVAARGVQSSRMAGASALSSAECCQDAHPIDELSFVAHPSGRPFEGYILLLAFSDAFFDKLNLPCCGNSLLTTGSC